MSAQVQRGGTCSTLQDAGRTGLRHLGVGRGGALDAYSHAIANLLVGNAPDATVLEVTLRGPCLRFERAARIALCGAPFDAQVDGVALPAWCSARVPAGATLDIGACRVGMRACLAVAGGFDAPIVLGSTGTDLRAGFGGLEGRALRPGDTLHWHGTPDVASFELERGWIDWTPDLVFADAMQVRVLPGRDALAAPDALVDTAWRVASASNRQGLRLDGEALALATPRESVSEPVAPGTVQLPPDGRPIVLLADAQTVGGYPRIGHVCSADLPRLAQARPGTLLHFVRIDASAAAAAEREQRQRLARIALAIAQRDAHAPR
ncbi:biotin-dependent carboxyltransferase family protein [Chiayiivirga flava]|uniref:Antagonist of KipI n=1 Tax=Chiayiivirga flava TaxID=659595 RepID=A0A7W8D2G5_9GAMM|nr:biotin-dependent carboxyltransferase family protein [Chiayiivirga flava]MBB5206696.1 antagonist of KipI [Chiayiivirga flava]